MQINTIKSNTRAIIKGSEGRPGKLPRDSSTRDFDDRPIGLATYEVLSLDEHSTYLILLHNL